MNNSGSNDASSSHEGSLHRKITIECQVESDQLRPVEKGASPRRHEDNWGTQCSIDWDDAVESSDQAVKQRLSHIGVSAYSPSVQDEPIFATDLSSSATTRSTNPPVSQESDETLIQSEFGTQEIGPEFWETAAHETRLVEAERLSRKRTRDIPVFPTTTPASVQASESTNNSFAAYDVDVTCSAKKVNESLKVKSRSDVIDMTGIVGEEWDRLSSQQQQQLKSNGKSSKNIKSNSPRKKIRKTIDYWMSAASCTEKAGTAKKFSLKDTDERWFLGDRLFKKDETFYDEKGYVFTLTGCKFHHLQLKKFAVCVDGARIPIKDTFIGETLAKRLLSDAKWRRCCGMNELGLMRCTAKHMFHFQPSNENILPLESLKERIQLDPSSPECFYIHEHNEAPSMSKDFKFAYLSKHMLQAQNWVTVKSLKSKPVVLEYFAGAGCMHLAFEKAGFAPRAHLVENNPHAAATLRTNFRKAEVYEECVRVFLRCCLDGHSGYPKPGEIDHIHASSPCQGFSRGNRNQNDNSPPSEKDIENNELSYTIIDAIRHFRPRTASFENVQGMLREGTRIAYLRRIVADLLEMQYQCRFFCINSEEHGDPQKRIRAILFASRSDAYLPDIPIASAKAKTILETLHDLVDIVPTPGCGRVQTKDGRIITSHGLEDGLDIKEGENLRLSQCVDGTAMTIVRQKAIKHPILHRLCTIRERARLMSIPDWFQICGRPINQRDQIGNAIPVATATSLARAIFAAHHKRKRRTV